MGRPTTSTAAQSATQGEVGPDDARDDVAGQTGVAVEERDAGVQLVRVSATVLIEVAAT